LERPRRSNTAQNSYKITLLSPILEGG
jgi:hypothetical protein